MQEKAPTYRPVRPDGAAWKCTSCECYRFAGDTWFVELPNGWRGAICNECLEPDWKSEATFIKEPV